MLKNLINKYYRKLYTDKFLHFIMCYAICLTVYTITSNLDNAVGITLLLGVIKEIIDRQVAKSSNSEILGDLAFDLLGISGVVLTVFIKLNIK